MRCVLYCFGLLATMFVGEVSASTEAEASVAQSIESRVMSSAYLALPKPSSDESKRLRTDSGKIHWTLSSSVQVQTKEAQVRPKNLSDNLARWDSRFASPSGCNGNVYAIRSLPSGLLVVGGAFSVCGGVSANGIVLYDPSGNTWLPLGAGVNGSVRSISISSNGLLIYVGGTFNTAGGITANHVARVTAIPPYTNWEALGSGSNFGVGGSVNGISLDPSGANLFVTGIFPVAGYNVANNTGTVAASRIARYNISGKTWAALGSGLNGDGRNLVVSDSDVYVSGSFSTAGGVASARLAKFSISGQSWSQPVGGVSLSFIPAGVYQSDVSSGRLFVSGYGSFNSGSVPFRGLAELDTGSNSIVPLSSAVVASGALGFFSAVEAVIDDSVYFGGGFDGLDGVSSSNLIGFRRSSSSWFNVGGGADGEVEAILVVGSSLYLGGRFGSVGQTSSRRFARYDARRDTSTTIFTSPSAHSVANASVTLSASVATSGFPADMGKVEFIGSEGVIDGCSDVDLIGEGDVRYANCSTTSLRVGTHSLVARYQGDSVNFIGTSDPVALTVSAPVLELAPTALPNGHVGIPYSQVVEVSGDAAMEPVSYAVTAGAVPSGLTLLPNGQLSGNPNLMGAYDFTVTATDSSTTSATGGAFSTSRAYTVTTSLQATTATIGTISPSPSLVGQAYSVPVTVTSAQSTPNGVVFCSDGSGASDTKALIGGQATCSLTSSSAGPKTISVVYGVQGNYDASVGTKTHTVQNANQPPVLSYNPAAGTVSFTGAGSALGASAAGSIAVSTQTAATGTGATGLACSIVSGNFVFSGSGTQNASFGPFNTGTTTGSIGMTCTRQASVQTAQLSCTPSNSPGGQLPALNWTLSCPSADAVPPTLTYVPEPNNTVVFPSGNVNQTVSTAIQVNSSGAVGSGSTTLTCAPFTDGQFSAFQLTGGNGQTLSTTQGGQPLQLSCTLGLQLRTTTLSCTETDSPGGVTRGRTWPLTCGPGVATADGEVTVGARNAVRGGQVAIPITFRGEGQTRDFRAEMSFDKTHLTVLQVTPVGGATCARRLAPNDDRIEVQRGTAGPLSAEDTRYCEVRFQVASNAPGGALNLPVAASTCVDTGGASKPCTTSDGRVAVAALDPSPADGAAIVIAGYDGTQTRTLRVVNRGAVPQELSGCTVLPSTGLSVTQPTNFPLAIPVQTERQVTLSCVLPPLNQPRLATLTCDTNDAMRSQMRYGVTCLRLPEGTPLPAEQVLDIEQRAGEQQGTSAARGDSGGTTKGTMTDTVTFLGAPLGGSDGNGRVAVYADAGTPIGKARGEWQAGALRRVATLDVPLLLRGWDKGTSGATERLGQALALRADGAVLAVGAPQGGPTGAGRVYLYQRPAGGWALFDSRTALPDTLEAPSLPGGATLEYGAAITYTPQGDLLVGAPGATVGVSGAGAVFAHAWNGTGFDAPVSVVSAQPVGNGRFGSALAANDDDLLVGAPGEFTASTRTGAAYRLALLGGTPGAPTRLIPTTALAANDQYGAAVAIAGEQWFVGAPGDDTAQGTDSGSVIAFRSGPAPTQLTQLLPATGTQQGAGSALTANDRYLFVGAPQADTTTQADAGRTYVYALKATYAATESPKSALDNAAGRANDQFGRSLVVGNGLLIVGVPQADVILSDTTQLDDVGRADPFLLIELFGNGFE
jgi:hypothetical protein